MVYQLKMPYRDGTTHFVFEPLEFLVRLAALVPRPRGNLVRYHGILAPNAKHRNAVVPNPSQQNRRALSNSTQTVAALRSRAILSPKWQDAV